MPPLLPLRFSARSVTGASRGRELGYPTINLHLEDVPNSLKEGIYACRAHIDGQSYQAAMHYGPRPVFHADRACEMHLLDVTLPSLPQNIETEVVERIRDVEDFPSADALKVRIAQDIERTRAILE